MIEYQRVYVRRRRDTADILSEGVVRHDTWLQRRCIWTSAHQRIERRTVEHLMNQIVRSLCELGEGRKIRCIAGKDDDFTSQFEFECEALRDGRMNIARDR